GRSAAGVEDEQRRGETILRVDDDRDVTAVVAELLRDEGHSVVVAGSAASAIERLGATDVAVVLLDLRLPDADGIELMRRILAREAAPEVVVMTGHATLQSPMPPIQAAPPAYLAHPA